MEINLYFITSPILIYYLYQNQRSQKMTAKEYIEQVREEYGTLMLDKKQTARELGISVNGLDNLRTDGEIKFITIGNRIKFNASDIAKMMRLA